MKLSLLTLTLLFSFTAWSKTEVKDFNKVLLNGVQKDIKDEHNDRFRKVGRGPASVEEDVQEDRIIDETKKIDKSNFRQIGGPSKW
jgi:hypothetical protein